MRNKSLALILALFSTPLLANHGPGASGGGSSTLSGETLKENHFELSLREDFSQFEHFDTAAAESRARQGGDFDALDHGFITTAEIDYGLTDNLQLSASIGYFAGNDFLSSDYDSSTNTVDTSRTNPDGLTDIALLAKYRFLQGPAGNLAVLTGVSLPTGRDDVRLHSGESLSPTDQPGTGRWGLPIGLGYSRFLTSNLTVDTSAVYTFRFEQDHFKVGDRMDFGLALAYRLTDSIKSFPQFSVFAELNDVFLQQDQISGERDPNSGSNTLYITPGFRMRIDPHTSFTLAPSFPVIQSLNGDQGRIEYKIALTFSLSF